MTSLLLGLSVADALGVPVEFKSREDLAKDPVMGVRGFGTYDQPPGTFSDDSTMAFCLAETIVKSGGTLPLDYRDLADRYIAWCDRGYWTPHGERFDIGRITWAAIQRMRDPTQDLIKAGGRGEYDNGNGSLMRILPLVTLTRKLDDPHEKLRLVGEVSAMTHGHARSVLCCLYYLLLAERVIEGEVLAQAYASASAELRDVYLAAYPSLAAEAPHLGPLLDGSIAEVPEAKIYGDGYVVNCLKASVWCLFQTDSYAAAVLRAINLGEDTDTTAAVTGGLAALVYGVEAIPDPWLYTLVRREDVEDLGRRLAEATQTSPPR